MICGKSSCCTANICCSVTKLVGFASGIIFLISVAGFLTSSTISSSQPLDKYALREPKIKLFFTSSGSRNSIGTSSPSLSFKTGEYPLLYLTQRSWKVIVVRHSFAFLIFTLSFMVLLFSSLHLLGIGIISDQAHYKI